MLTIKTCNVFFFFTFKTVMKNVTKQEKLSLTVLQRQLGIILVTSKHGKMQVRV
jgi:hypothetical protein